MEALGKKALAEGQQETATFEKFQAWCAKSKKTLDKAIAGEQEAIEGFKAGQKAQTIQVQLFTEGIAEIGKQVAGLTAAGAAADADRAEAVALHNKTSEDFDSTISAVSQAIEALEASKTPSATEEKVAESLVQLPMFLESLSGQQEAWIVSLVGQAPEAAPAASPLTGAPPPKEATSFKSGSVVDMLKKLKLEFADKKASVEMEEMSAANEYSLAKASRDEAIRVASEAQNEKAVAKSGVESELITLEANLKNKKRGFGGRHQE